MESKLAHVEEKLAEIDDKFVDKINSVERKVDGVQASLDKMVDGLQRLEVAFAGDHNQVLVNKKDIEQLQRANSRIGNAAKGVREPDPVLAPLVAWRQIAISGLVVAGCLVCIVLAVEYLNAHLSAPAKNAVHELEGGK